MSRKVAVFAVAVALASGLGACNRNLEPFDPDEEPQEPELSKIFPAGAERAAPALAGMPEPPGPAGGRGAPPVASDAPPIRGTVTLAEELRDRVRPGSVLFLMARADESGPPLAVKRIADPRFPLAFSLGPDDRMLASLPFAGPLRLTARLDGDGNASTRSPGDLQGAAAGRHDPGAENVRLVLDEELGAATAAPAPVAAGSAPADSGPAVRGTVTLAEELRGQLRPGAVLFLIARTGEAGPPLAVKRIADPRFPLAFSLGPDDRMLASRPFAGPLRLTARLDGDGNAITRDPGDLEGTAPGRYQPGAENVSLVLDQQL